MNNVTFGSANINFNLPKNNKINNMFSSIDGGCKAFGIISITNENTTRIESTVRDIIQEIHDKLKDHDRDLIIGYTKFQRQIVESVEIVVKKVFSGMYIGQFIINVDFERCDDCNKMVIYDQNEIIKLTIELKG